MKRSSPRAASSVRECSSNLCSLFIAPRTGTALIRGACFHQPIVVRMNRSAIEFDPYRNWLNVSDAERPPGPYQILGLQVLESSPSRIRLAYEGQCQALRRAENQAEASVWQEVKGNLDAAFAILQDPQRKAILDAALRRKLPAITDFKAAAAAASPTAAPVACFHCRRENPAGRRFCGGCGKSLWEKCPRCG